MWDVEYAKAFEDWWNGLDSEAQEAVTFLVELLIRRGPHLDHPFSTVVYQSKPGSSMRELRLQLEGRPVRILYAIDPHRGAILLLGLS